jgi:hypothetical protein
MSIEAMKQVIELYDKHCYNNDHGGIEFSKKHGYKFIEAIEALRTAIQQAEAQQPAPGVPDDSKRLDYLQDRGATIDLIPGVADFYPMQFRVGGVHSSANTDVRAAIDAAMLAASPATTQPKEPS